MTSASFHRFGSESKFARQRGNEAFTEFLMTLKFPRDQDIFELFSCSKCEQNVGNGFKRMDGVVMDGSAVGILGKLPPFERQVRIMKPTARISDRQYLIRVPKHRKFVDVLPTSAKNVDRSGSFYVPLRQGLWDNRDELARTFFDEIENDANDTRPVSKFITAAFELVSKGNGVWEVEYNTSSNEDCLFDDNIKTSGHKGRIFVRHRNSSIDIRGTLIDFGRCFCSGSVAGGALRDGASILHALHLKDALQKVAHCLHVQGSQIGQTELEGHPICSNCIYELNETATKAQEFIPSLTRLCFAIADSATYGAEINLRKFCSAIADVVFAAMNVRGLYFEYFATNEDEDISSYNSIHREGSGLEQSETRGWLEEACQTGELFPGRPQVRPNIDFGTASRNENSKSCRKVYTKGNYHTPGIFIAQCVCRHPKLLSVSVMTNTEGVSTALSVLLSRFKILPRVCYYDNGCNMARSIVLRVPWVNKACRILCDRFHYAQHTCNSICDPDSYYSCTDHATSGAESINQLWTFSKSDLRFLQPSNLMPFIAARAVFLNVRSSVREMSRKCDICAQMALKFVREKWQCICPRCMITS